MGWYDYYKLLEEYDGDLSKATKEQMKWAARGNPNDPTSAREMAEKQYKADYEDIPELDDEFFENLC